MFRRDVDLTDVFCLSPPSQRGSLTQIPVVKETQVESGQFLLLSVLCMLSVLVALAVSVTFFCVRQRSHLHMKEKLSSLGTDTSTEATATYQVRTTPSPHCQPIALWHIRLVHMLFKCTRVFDWWSVHCCFCARVTV